MMEEVSTDLIEKLKQLETYVQRGWHIFPVEPNTKLPAKGPNGVRASYHKATNNHEKALHYFTKNPNANIGLNLEASGLVCVDVDSYKDDCEFHLFMTGKEMPPTLTQRSASGGHHYFFKVSEGDEFVGQLCKGVDIKHKGYVLLEPSVFKGSPYRWETDDEPAPVPDWVTRKNALPSVKSPSTPIDIDLGSSNLNTEEAIGKIRQGDNWHDNMLRLTAHFVSTGYTPQQIHAITDRLTLSRYTIEQTRQAVQKMIDGAKNKGFEKTAKAECFANLSGFNFISAEELVTKRYDPVKFLVPDILPEIGLAMISGAPKVGKSYFCLHLVSKIPSDRKIIYLSAEDNERRLQTRIAQVFPSSTPKNLLLFAGLSSGNPLPRGAAALGFIRNVKAKYPSTACVFIDTVAGIRERTGAEKNYETTEAEFGALRKLAHELGIAVVAVHHNRKKTDTGGSPLEAILGSQGISATVETILILQQVVGSQSIDLFVTGKDIVEQELRYEWQSPGFAAAGETIEAALGSFQRACLDHIRDHPRCTQQAISEETKRSKSTVSEAIAKLIQRGLVTKAENGRLIIPLTNPTNLTN